MSDQAWRRPFAHPGNHVTASDTVALDGSRLENQATPSRTMSSVTRYAPGSFGAASSMVTTAEAPGERSRGRSARP